MRKAQSTFDYLILTGVILAVIIPLLFFSTERIDRNRLAELQDALGALKDGITQVNNLGFGTSSVVVLRVPKGVTEQRVGRSNSGSIPWCNKGMLCYKVAGNDMSVTVPADVDGVLPLNEGLHYVQLFNNGTNVLLYECGNNKREAFEQCDGTDNSACGSFGCAAPSHSQACKCICEDNRDCSGTTGLCDSTGLNPTNVCIPCSTNDQCGGGRICLDGRCVAPTRCTTNDDCISYPNEVCNRDNGQCEPCVIPEIPNKKCDKPQHSCLNRFPNPNVCGPPGVRNTPPEVDAGPNQVVLLSVATSLGGSIRDDGVSTLPSAAIVTTTWSLISGPPSASVSFTNNPRTTAIIANNANTWILLSPSIATFSQSGFYTLRLTANDGEFTSSDELTVTVQQQIACGPTLPSVCPTGTSCVNGYCQAPISCPIGYINIGGVCQPSGGTARCGNGRIESGETCDFDYLRMVAVGSCPSPSRCNPFTCQCAPQGNAYCGNGIVESPEYCDDGVSNGLLIPGSTCGPGLLCTLGCTCYIPPDYCGDGRISSTGWEQCDFRASPTGCPTGRSCTSFCECRPRASSCGDGVVDPVLEECEPIFGTVTGLGCPLGMTCLADCTCRGGPGVANPPNPNGPGGPGDPSPNSPGPSPPGFSSGPPITPSPCRTLPLTETTTGEFTCGGSCSPGYSCNVNPTPTTPQDRCACLPDGLTVL